MTKKQLLQALSIVEEDAEVTAIFQGKYLTRYPALVNGINIVLTALLRQNSCCAKWFMRKLLKVLNDHKGLLL